MKFFFLFVPFLLLADDWKENVMDFPDFTQDIMFLRPVTYRIKGGDQVSYGFLTEEVEAVFPELIRYMDGKPHSVLYHKLPVILLAEIQKLRRELDEVKCKLDQFYTY